MKKMNYFEKILNMLDLIFHIHGSIMSEKCHYHFTNSPGSKKYYPKAFWYWINTSWVDGD